ncbi:hepatocyte growth factor-regulated tyrosine kinase substrate-like [Oppia nitens]|uniref:hepatocyte growth factor-regulated tyrosine kinase substrate-like n=1 Tax=Oppia nitens TaxID=1686743 RepID=UPI0023DB7733|nr:hepatocyte growth factor-regulated tyrosine kinase substrate-like [Oppia nitens]
MFKSSATFDRLLDRATSLTNLEPDWNAILLICDTIRQNDVQPKYAVNAIKKKLYATNPNVELLAIQVLESCAKNCGTPFHNEIATKAFMEELRDIVKMSSDTKVRDEILKLIQVWAHAFRNDSNFRVVQDTVNLMKIEGYKFPVLKESDAMFAADSAPEWADGECCHRCRTQFSMVQRKHHCRNCGQIFCQKCSSKMSPIPKYGIEKEVRVCDDCFDKLNKLIKPVEQLTTKSGTTSAESPYSSVKSKNETTKSEREIQEEEELQLALALSQSEAESKERENKMRSYSTPSYSSGTTKSSLKTSSPKKLDSSTKSLSNNSIEISDPELSRYLNREYWEQKSMSYQLDESTANKPTPSAPQPQQLLNNSVKTSGNIGSDSNKSKYNITNGLDDEMESFLVSLKSAIEIFVNRINSNQLRGRPIANDSAVQSLFMNITNMHSTLLAYIQQQDNDRTHFESLQDKLGQIRDARAALDALREEHREQMRREAEEAERLRQQQMAQKLEIMRKKKQEYLQYQREIALQRMQEQEREMMLRQEQQKYIPNVWHPSQPVPQALSSVIPQSLPQSVPQVMYSNGPQAMPSNYVPYGPPTGPQPLANQTIQYGAPNTLATSGQNVNLYGQQNSGPQYPPPAPQPPPLPTTTQTPQSSHIGGAQQINPYNMQNMMNTLPQIPVNVVQGSIMSMNAPVGPHTDGSQQNPVPQAMEAPLISFD